MKTFFIIMLTAMLSVPSFAQSRTERREAEAARIMEMVSDTVYTISHFASALFRKGIFHSVRRRQGAYVRGEGKRLFSQ